MAQAVPPTRRIASANDEFQLALALRANRRQRRRQGRFLVEGVRAIDQAVAHGWAIDSFWYHGERRLSRWAAELLDRGLARRHVELAPELMAELSAKEETSELIALVELPPDDVDRIPRRPDALVVAFDRPTSPGNLGSVIRSCDAFGADGLVVTGHAVDVYDPQTVRASVGSLFAVPVVAAAGPADVARWLAPGVQVVGSSAHAETELGDADLARPTLLVLGNETRGLTVGWRELCDAIVRIPMRGSASSLNVAAAASVLLYEADRQRRRRVRNGTSHSA